MTLFLTSSPGGYRQEADRFLPCQLDERNGLVAQLARRWPGQARILFVSADPDAGEMNDAQRENFAVSFSMSGLPVACVETCDGRRPDLDPRGYDVLILGGGHVPTQKPSLPRSG